MMRTVKRILRRRKKPVMNYNVFLYLIQTSFQLQLSLEKINESLSHAWQVESKYKENWIKGIVLMYFLRQKSILTTDNR